MNLAEKPRKHDSFRLSPSASSIPLMAALLSALVGIPATADTVLSPQRQVTKISDRIFTIRHKDPMLGWVHGNTTVIIGEREVFVVDSCQTPSAAREDIAQIRQWTDKPVRYLLNTHWHEDHNGGNHEYMTAFPSLAIIAHPETRKQMDEYAPSLTALWLKGAADIRATLNQRLETGKGREGKPLTEAQRADFKEQLQLLDRIPEEAKAFVYQAPTLTFERELAIDIGGTEVQVKHLGRANTAGDALVYLPKEKILVTGDILVHPIPYTFDGYPSEWIHTLEAMVQLPADTIVPGHGDVLQDKQFAYDVIDMMKSVVAQVEQQFRKNPNVTLDEVTKAMDLKVFRQKLAGDDQTNGRNFDNSIGTHLIEVAYNEHKLR